MAVQIRNPAHIDLQASDLRQNKGELHLSSDTAAAAYSMNQYTVVLATGGGGGIAVTLPTAATNTGKTYAVKKVDAGAGAVTVTPAGADTIDGAANHPLANQHDGILICCDGADWWILAGWP